MVLSLFGCCYAAKLWDDSARQAVVCVPAEVDSSQRTVFDTKRTQSFFRIVFGRGVELVTPELMLSGQQKGVCGSILPPPCCATVVISFRLARPRSSEHIRIRLPSSTVRLNVIWRHKRGTWLYFSNTTTVPAPAVSSPTGACHRLGSPLRIPRTWGPPRTGTSGKPNRDSWLRRGFGALPVWLLTGFWE